MATEVVGTRQVFDHHLGALMAGDLEGLLSDYTEDSVIIVPDGIVRGRAAIETLFAGFLTGLLRPGTYEVAADIVHMDGEVLYIVWHANCEPADVVFATDTFLIRDGKIAVQTFAAKIELHS